MAQLSLRGGGLVTPAARGAKTDRRRQPAGITSTAVRNSLRCTVGEGRAGGDDDLHAAAAPSLRMGWGGTPAAKRASCRDRPIVRRADRRRRCQIRRRLARRRRCCRDRSVGRSTRAGSSPECSHPRCRCPLTYPNTRHCHRRFAPEPNAQHPDQPISPFPRYPARGTVYPASRSPCPAALSHGASR